MNRRQKKKLINKHGIRKWHNIKVLRKIKKDISRISRDTVYSFNKRTSICPIIDEIMEVYIISSEEDRR